MGRAPAKPTPWRALAEQLADEGCESIYLTRLRAQHDVRAHVDTLAEEVAEEMARALGRTTSRVDYAFACLERDRQRAHDADGVRVRAVGLLAEAEARPVLEACAEIKISGAPRHRRDTGASRSPRAPCTWPRG